MAKYGLDLYGSALYGDPNPLLYTAEPVEAIERNYGSIFLSWRKPGGTWTTFSLVRNYMGYPVEITDGDLLINASDGQTTFYEDDTVEQGVWVYYGLFVYIVADAAWFRVGTASVFSPVSYDGPAGLYNRMPRVYRSNPGASDGNADFLAFLSIMGFQWDVLRNLANSTLDLDDPYLISYDMVPYRLAELGIPDGLTVLSPRQNRSLLANALFLLRSKGTRPCVQALSSLIMGVDCQIAVGNNMLWTADLSDFLGGTGTWFAAGATGVIDWTPKHIDGFSGNVTPAMKITQSGLSENYFFVDQSSPLALKQLGIPVTPGITYVAQAFAEGSDSHSNVVALTLAFYDATGASVGSAALPVTTALRNGSSVIFGTSAVSPAGAAYMSLRLMFSVTGGASTVYVTSVQVNQGSAILPHQPGRDIQISIDDGGLTALQIATREARLRDMLPRYLPLGATYSLIHGATPPPAYLAEDVLIVKSY